MSVLSQAFGQGSLNTGAGLPWGPGGWQATPGNQAITTGAGTPWGTTGQKGVFGLEDPVTMAVVNQGQGGNTSNTQAMDNALFTGSQTPWGAPGDKSMSAFQDPVTRNVMNTTGAAQNSGSYPNSLNQGALADWGFDTGIGSAPSTPTLQTDPTQYTAPSYSDYNTAGQETINTGLANQNNSLAAAMAAGGSLHSGDTGAGISANQANADQQRGGLANAISQMQYGNQVGQLNAANTNTTDAYNNALANYQAKLTNQQANQATAHQALGTAGTIGAALLYS